jgi:DNA modification methylase
MAAGDNLQVLRKSVKDETVDLCYIDPPFNSQRDYNQIYNNIGEEDQAQAQAFTDTWVWDEIAIAGHDEIIANEKGRFTPQVVELIKGLHSVIGDGSLLAYLVSLALRVTEIHRVLKSTGSFYLHCDPTASHYLKLVLDAIICAQGGDFKTRSFGNEPPHAATLTSGITFTTLDNSCLLAPQPNIWEASRLAALPSCTRTDCHDAGF